MISQGGQHKYGEGKKEMVNMRHHYFFTKNTPELTEIINNTRGGIDGKIGERGALRANSRPGCSLVHDFPDKKSF